VNDIDFIKAYEYFESGDESIDPVLKEQRGRFPKFVANRAMNELASVLKKAGYTPQDAGVVDAGFFRCLCFMMMAKAIDKKDFVRTLEWKITKKS
jgi:hypothetical protein